MSDAVPKSSEWLLCQPVPNATTCILVGALGSLPAVEFQRFQQVLWFVDAAHQALPVALRPERIQRVLVETTPPAEAANRLEQFLRRNPRLLPSLFVTRQILVHHPAAYAAVVDEIHRQMESTHRARLTRQLDGFTWQKHILGNAAAYAARRLPAEWTGALHDVPAFVCGAGPSLDVSVAPLAAYAKHAVVFAADSALRALARHGVHADFAISIDAAKIPAKCLPDRLPPTRVVLASVSPPEWQQALPDTGTCFLSSNQLTDDWFAAQGVARTAIAASESCGSTGIDLAIHLGCGPIYLFGIDLAVDPSNQAQRHQRDADPTLYQQSNYDPTAQLPRVPGNYVDQVPCFALGDWRALDERLAARTSPTIYNVNDRGARLRGTTLVHPGRLAEPRTSREKAGALAALATPTAASAVGSVPLLRLRTVGERGTRSIPALRQALGRGGPSCMAPLLQRLLLEPDCGRALGAFSLKVMPHLVPPIEGSPEFWSALLDEFAQLSQLAQQIKLPDE
ncbi:6-hydroxymethylpterin diphosphokinase MptE-like protein [Opitutus terrae]|uniref:6-hydroxymethylpterin diphosphokinase MptE-like domain-containing protein n=1 Tax=Opitutus terrae (strain DSM 11246 / JCM 15787 / PB90-1) TaxID=452637 RepID=B1ZRP6_OPITP|nr:6-hydroxymethylpterin diphosphokinase MptE-like protein [Opitutus terrae]ACB73739.1 conserved hypothetical protein [Opitutus terrae PB90-1]